jgi:II/X family phage/plasmid replication protein
LPDGDLWTVERADWAEAFDMGSFEAVQEWVHGLSLARFPRRKVNRYSDEAVNFSGRTTTVNLYHKGPEFLVHDRKRLKACIGMAETAELLDLANRLLRFEVQVKGPKLEADFGAKPPVVQVTQAYLEGVHDREGSRLIREGKAEMDTVRTHTEVSNRLRQVYGTRRANTLFGTWMQLAALGEDHVKRGMNRATFYRQRKQLVEAAIAWHGADVCIVPGVSAVPRGFAPIRSDPRRMIGEAPEVARQLAPFRLIA